MCLASLSSAVIRRIERLGVPWLLVANMILMRDQEVCFGKITGQETDE